MYITKSPIKWVGGKAREIKFFEEYIPDFNLYIEPFVGGGALFWHLQPTSAVLGDINEYLMNFYIQLRDNYTQLNQYNQIHEHNKTYYKKMVEKVNDNNFVDNIEKASVFYYINKTCFSGKWRVNSKGEFNNTWGNYKRQNYKKLDKQYSSILKNTTLVHEDYKKTLTKYKNKDDAFVFLDPPYLDCDTMYTKDQKFKSVYDYILKYMKDCECKVMLVVKSNEYILNLFNDFIVKKYDKKYCHNSTSKKEHTHLLICNYDIQN